MSFEPEIPDAIYNCFTNQQRLLATSNFSFAFCAEMAIGKSFLSGEAVGPDWAIFQVLGKKFSHKSSPNILVTFWAIL